MSFCVDDGGSHGGPPSVCLMGASTHPRMDGSVPGSRDTARERLYGLLALGVALVLLVSSVTWFGTGQTLVGVLQLVLGVVLAVVGGFLLRRSRRA